MTWTKRFWDLTHSPDANPQHSKDPLLHPSASGIIAKRAMENLEKSREILLQQISDTEAHLLRLRQELEWTENRIRSQSANDNKKDRDVRRWPLLQEEYRRYGRQMILDQIGLEGQLKLRGCSVLIVGAGGLGCPAAMYLAGAGIGTIGLVDGDTVEHSNLHRQVLHRTKNVGNFKVDSAIEYLQDLNPHPKYIAYRNHLTPQDARDIFSSFDVILDCTDNPASRYLISDTAVLLQKPLISASALRTEGQLMVLNYPPLPQGNASGGPCYRCIFPKPPPAESVVSCADGGILGPVVGLMGVMQALETIRVIIRELIPPGPTGHASTPPDKMPITLSLHLFSAYSTPSFRTIRLRPRRSNCIACSATATITLDTLGSGLTDYDQFCGSISPVSLLAPHERISASEYNKMYPSLFPPDTLSPDNLEAPTPIMIDVREAVQYGICNLPRSVNIPMSTILSSPLTAPQSQHQTDATKTELPAWFLTSVLSTSPDRPIYTVCRLGNDSQIAVKKLKELGADRGGKRLIGDIKGGFRAWREEVDPEWPDY